MIVYVLVLISTLKAYDTNIYVSTFNSLEKCQVREIKMAEFYHKSCIRTKINE